MDREQLRGQLEQRLTVERAPDGTRLVTLNNVVLGRLGQNADGHWELDVRSGWRRERSQFTGSESEHAEVWALGEIADWMSLERATIAAGKPWGDPPPPGVGQASSDQSP